MKKLRKIIYLIFIKLKKIIDKFSMKLFHIKTILQEVDFVNEISPENNGLDPKKVKRCTHSNTPYLKKTLKLLRISKNDSILDIGCSKGAALLCMHEFPFRKIHGIEISDNLVHIANNNFLRLRKKNIGITNIDALDFKDYKEYNIFYIYNSLFPQDLKKVLEIILNSNKNRDIFFIYNNPRYAYVFEDFPIYLIKNLLGNWEHRIYLYSNVESPIRFN